MNVLKFETIRKNYCSINYELLALSKTGGKYEKRIFGE